MANVNYIGKNIVTTEAEALYFKLGSNFDDFEGKKKYVANIVFTQKSDEDKMKAMFDQWLDEAKNHPDNKGKKWRSSDDQWIGYKFNEKLGKTVFTFKTLAFRMVDGVETQITLPVFDKYGKPISDPTTIGNGSKVQIRFDASWYHKSASSNGLSMFLTGIVVKEHKEYNSDAQGFSFEEFQIPAVNSEEIPF